MDAFSNTSTDNNMLHPPINRAMRALDRSLFHKTIPLASARVLDKRLIARCRSKLNHDLLSVSRVSVVQQDPCIKDLKVLLLQPHIKPNSMVLYESI